MLDGFPKTIKQSQLMASRGIIPMILFELELDSVELLRRGLLDKMKPNKLVRKTHTNSNYTHLYKYMAVFSTTNPQHWMKTCCEALSPPTAGLT